MNKLSTAAVLAGAIVLSACQSGQQMAMLPGSGGAAAPAPARMDGQWASTDGIFVASFRGGEFTSVDAQTNAVLAQGTYDVSGNQVQMNWLSTSSNERRSATCTFAGGALVNCTQASGATFGLRRA